jgi:hypothetical protein|tara:strand:+ start:205 stop:867 length:663 start_codon:yes stop_codon:yes gene_type:complete
MSLKLICEVNEDINYITEAKDEDGKKSYFIEGVFMQGDIKNRNGRMYPKDVLAKEVSRYNKEYVEKKRAYGELGHPQGPTINLERVSHMITELKQDGSNFMGKAKIMTETPYGAIVKSLMDEGAQLGVSSRGMGSLKAGKAGAQEVQKDFYLATAADIVADPSAPDAFVNGIMESKEWVWENGIIREATIADYETEIKKASKSELESVKLKVFENFLSKL